MERRETPERKTHKLYVLFRDGSHRTIKVTWPLKKKKVLFEHKKQQQKNKIENPHKKSKTKQNKN